ncbi:hypothetical protein EST38_g6392 [Candolleomyces aberdarensis]|uniref:Uncharacterized protein n=1 Tax=Candolleomyces aberdarensis TaxID=2316362 RepID=A0A4Q2DJV7_9AGAR|nr:hypothetical protein EST38_g6392 [Candolleomyces aberdarensis]
MASTSCNTPQTPALKARRRRCNLSPSEIQIARDFVGIGDDDDSSDREDRLLLVPPSSGRFAKGSSPVPSPDSFRLTFTDASYNFPHPPIPTPTSLTSRNIESFYGSSKSPETSPCSSEQPLTPSSSDDEFFGLPSPKFNPRRAAIQPLVIRKHASLSSSPVSEPDFLVPTKPTDSAQPALSPFTSEESSSDSESDAESDSEWYHNELSKVLTVQARTPAPAATEKARPDSIFISPPTKRFSRALHPTDSPFSPRRQSYRIPNYPPPPVPSSSRQRPISPLVPMSPTSPYSSRFSVSSRSPIRPPPRSSVPADFEFDHEDDASSFSFALYQYEEEDASLKSLYSQPSFVTSPSPLDEVEFDLDMEYPMMLPVSIPGTPVDLESDFATGLEELRSRSAVSCPSPLPSVPEDPQEIASISEFSFSPSIKAPEPWSPSRDSFSSFYVYTPPMSPTNPSPAPAAPAAPVRFTIEDEERVLKSKWSSSTLGSIREEHEKRISSRLRLFSPSKKHSRSSSKTGVKVPQTPLSPMSFLTSSPSKKAQPKPVVTTPTPSPKKHSRQRSNDALAAYGQSGVGVKRRGSCTTVSDAGSDDSALSSSSSGLRRKPIPVELFMRK